MGVRCHDSTMSSESATFTRSAPWRSSSNRVLAGVAGGLSERWGVESSVVRCAFVALCPAAGVGLAIYMIIWTITSQMPGPPSVAQTTNRRSLALGFLTLSAVLGLRRLGLWLGDEIGLPIVLAATGWAVIYAPSDAIRRSKLLTMVLRRDSDEAARWVVVTQIVAGSAVVAVGVGAFLSASRYGSTKPLVPIFATVVGLAILFGPLFVRLFKQLADERGERIRTDERAEVAAHLHDSVLQTLALIQRADDSPARMANLARRQERELRAWLYDTGRRIDGGGITDALESIARDIESLHDIKVDVVVVGESTMTPAATALVHAIREAVTNAARHSGAPEVSIYVEVQSGDIEAFVRDRGHGFDPDSVEATRRGITDSIIGRIERHRGTASVQSSPDGTEVTMKVPIS